MMDPAFFVDTGILGGILITGGFALFSSDPFRAVVFFVGCGIFLSLAWIRLGAPDVALTEAAVGTGVTGALLIRAVPREQTARDTSAPRRVAKVVSGLLCAGLAVFLVPVAAELHEPRAGLMPRVLEHLPQAGVEHPVTAVLLNYRAYDTLLEMGVLFLAAVGVFSLVERSQAPQAEPAAFDPVLSRVVRGLVPALVLVGGYLLWSGSRAPGGAFQAGAVLGGAGILVQLAWSPLPLGGGWLRAAVVVGPLVFLVSGIVMAAMGGSFMEFPPSVAGAWILAIESACTVSIAAILNVVFAAAGPKQAGGGHDGGG